MRQIHEAYRNPLQPDLRPGERMGMPWAVQIGNHPENLADQETFPPLRTQLSETIFEGRTRPTIILNRSNATRTVHPHVSATPEEVSYYLPDGYRLRVDTGHHLVDTLPSTPTVQKGADHHHETVVAYEKGRLMIAPVDDVTKTGEQVIYLAWHPKPTDKKAASSDDRAQERTGNVLPLPRGRKQTRRKIPVTSSVGHTI